jgi:very-short-patch-repair endonuclease/predicted transcriptional regulator of viral defense system
MGPKRQTRGRGHAVAELASRQHGVVERGQLLALGLGVEAIKTWIRLGRLHPVHAGIYAVGHKSLSVPGRWMAAVLASGSGAALSHRSAGSLWGLRVWTGRRIDVTTPRKARGTGAIQRHYSLIPADEITEHEGIPVTTVPRTIFDMAAASPPQAVESMLREAEYRRLYDRLSLNDLLERYPRRRGSKAVRAALARLGEAPGRIRSPLEERFLPFLDRHRLPRPRFNVSLEVAGEKYQVDCLWADVRQIVELDGWEGHGTRSAFRDDRARDRRLRVAGYGVTRIAWSQLDDEPEAIAADLRALIYKRP